MAYRTLYELGRRAMMTSRSSLEGSGREGRRIGKKSRHEEADRRVNEREK